MDIYTTVAKILGNASLIAIPWNGGWTGWKIIFGLSRALDMETRLGFVGTPAGFRFLSRSALKWHSAEDPFANEITENEWHLLLLFHRRPLIVRLNCQVRLLSRYGLDVTRVPIMVGEHCDRCSSQAVVCEMWLYTCSLWHLFHHVVERSCTKRCAVKLDFVVWGIELLALTISWSLKHSIWRWQYWDRILCFLTSLFSPLHYQVKPANLRKINYKTLLSQIFVIELPQTWNKS